MAGRTHKPIAWLPVDSRLFGAFVSFGHVHGAARVFLILELILSTLVVVGALSVLFLKAARSV